MPAALHGHDRPEAELIDLFQKAGKQLDYAIATPQAAMLRASTQDLIRTANSIWDAILIEAAMNRVEHGKSGAQHHIALYDEEHRLRTGVDLIHAKQARLITTFVAIIDGAMQRFTDPNNSERFYTEVGTAVEEARDRLKRLRKDAVILRDKGFDAWRDNHSARVAACSARNR